MRIAATFIVTDIKYLSFNTIILDFCCCCLEHLNQLNLDNHLCQYNIDAQ